jgi:uncharacterized protein (DUF2147 family)
MVLLMISWNSKIFCQSSDTIIGYWLTIDETTKEPKSQIQIYKESDETFSGRIIWLQKPLKNDAPVCDEHNPDAALRSRRILDLLILKGFRFNGELWEDGTIYDPQSGKTYRCKMWFEDGLPNVLSVRGYIGISLLGRSVQWQREKQKR